MSRFDVRRCGHCGVRYTYQTSGYRGIQSDNDATYCPECLRVVRAALATVPVQARPEWVGTTDVTVAELVAQEAEVSKGTGCAPSRVLPPLFDLTCPENVQHQGIVWRTGRTYRYEYWTLQGGMEGGRVWVQVERNPTTGEILGPWEVHDRWVTVPTFVEHPPWPPRVSTHEFTPVPLAALEFRRSDLIERGQSLDYTPVGRSTLLVDPLPEGALPIYDKDSDGQ